MRKTVEQRLEEIEKILGLNGHKKVKATKVGDTFELNGNQWKVLDVLDDGVLCLCDMLPDMQFDTKSNNWAESSLREHLNVEFLEELAKAIGEENILEFERDLLSLDGQTEYGTCRDKVSMLTVDEYRKYRKLIPNTGKYWWTITPDSTACNEDTRWLRVVSPAGSILSINYDYNHGVRPVCIFSSAIFESEDA